MEPRKRQHGLDGIKLLGMYLVILYHVVFPHMPDVVDAPTAVGYLRYLLETFLGCCVPLFFMASGALALKKPVDLKKNTRRCLHLLVITVIWVFLALVRLERVLLHCLGTADRLYSAPVVSALLSVYLLVYPGDGGTEISVAEDLPVSDDFDGGFDLWRRAAQRWRISHTLGAGTAGRSQLGSELFLVCQLFRHLLLVQFGVLRPGRLADDPWRSVPPEKVEADFGDSRRHGVPVCYRHGPEPGGLGNL